jgi:hypothetical protein
MKVGGTGNSLRRTGTRVFRECLTAMMERVERAAAASATVCALGHPSV